MIPESTDHLSALKRAYLALQKMQSKLDAIEQDRTEPIAIIGMGCRFPGHANSPEAFWHLLQQGQDAVTEVPSDRWNIDAYYDPNPAAPGKMASRWGGFLDQVDQFDSLFFRISPRETITMDPQQRLLLEVSWEALEQAGQLTSALSGSRTGVFVGICSNDYSQMLLSQGPSAINPYMGTGSAHSVASGRLSYVLGLQGPSISVDTACSSSLVAVHLACQSLRNHECCMALAGGVNLILLPEVTINFSKAGMLSAEGRCKTFDAAANGYVRGEGCGVVVLKRLSDAIANGDNILALIRGSATNQDGRSGGLTVPNGTAQQAVMREALANAGIEPAQVQYIEAHGTGTALGDPIEARALSSVFAADRSANQPLLLGSVKTNIGHLEGAAGIAGLIKVVLSMQHQTIPMHLHFQSFNPHIDWGNLPVQIPTTSTPWTTEQPRIAGVSSFGFSGTNAHIVLESAPITESSETETPQLLVLSAKTTTALKTVTANLIQHLQQHPNLNLADVAYTLQVGRQEFSHRWMSVCHTLNDAIESLEKLERQQCSTYFQEGDNRAVVFLFPDQVPQLLGLTQELYQTEIIFQGQVDRACEWVQSELKFDLRQLLYPDHFNLNQPSEKQIEVPQHLENVVLNQLALFIIEYALAKLWMSWGVQPKVMIGSQVGEYAAACLAGVFSLEDALLLVIGQAKLDQHVNRMSLSVRGMQKYDLAIVSSNQTALYTEPKLESVGNCEEYFQDSSEQNDTVSARIESFTKQVESITLNPPEIPYLSATTGTWMTAEVVMNPGYWINQIFQPARSIETMVEGLNDPTCILLEMGVDQTFNTFTPQPNADSQGLRFASLRNPADTRSEATFLLNTIGQLWLTGISPQWSKLDTSFDQPNRHRIPLPTYPFERHRYWIK